MTGYRPTVEFSLLVRRPAAQVWEAFEDRPDGTLVAVHLDGFTGDAAAGQAIDAIPASRSSSPRSRCGWSTASTAD